MPRPQPDMKPYSRDLFTHQLSTVLNSTPNKNHAADYDFNDLLNIYDEHMNPDEYFDYVAHGAFKETYLLHDGNHVVKFCSQYNDTAAEMALLDAAKVEGLSHAFIPTQYIDFFGNITPMPILEADCDSDSQMTWSSKYSTWNENPDWEGRYAVGLEIQPTILYTCNSRGSRWSFELGYGECHVHKNNETFGPTHIISDPAIDQNTGEIVPYKILDALYIHNKEWIEAYVALYGIDGLSKLADFCGKYHIGDLHNGNIGFITSTALGIEAEVEYEVPVIIDWLSTDAETIKRLKEAV